MKPQQDPVVKDLNEWINRSAGQHKRAPLTSDAYLLHRVDSSQLGPRDGVSVGGCRTDIEFAGPEPESFDFYADVHQLKREGQAAFVIVMFILALIVIAFYSFTA